MPHATSDLPRELTRGEEFGREAHQEVLNSF